MNLREISRRDFLKLTGLGVTGSAVAVVVGCGSGNENKIIVKPLSTPTEKGGSKPLAETPLKTELINTPEVLKQKARLFAIDVRVETEGYGEGMKGISVDLGVENLSSEPLTLKAIAKQYDRDSKDTISIRTKEGFIYPLKYLDGIVKFVPDQVGTLLLLPPGFRAKAMVKGPVSYDNSPRAGDAEFRSVETKAITPKDIIPLARFTFAVAANTSGYKITIAGFPEIDLDSDIARSKNLKYPTDRPDSDFKAFPAVYEDKDQQREVRITLHDFAVDTETDTHYRGRALPDYNYYTFKARFENLNKGYGHSGSVLFWLIGDDGTIYQAPRFIEGTIGFRNNDILAQAGLGPGITKERIVNIALPKSLKRPKLIVDTSFAEDNSFDILNIP